MADENKTTCLRLMTRILKTLKTSHQPEEVYHLVTDLVHQSLQCQSCAIVLIDRSTEYLAIETSYGISHLFQKSYRKRISTGPIGRLVWDEQPIIIPDATVQKELAEQVMLEHPFGSCVCVQMSADHRTVGFLYVAKSQPCQFSSDDLALLQACADVAALAYYKSWLIDENLRMDRIDHETGLEKYSAFQERFAATMERAIHFQEPFALLVGDIDNFKSISHTYGYTAARQLLIEIGDIVRSSLRTIDGAARFGFDEFVFLRSNVGVCEAREFAESMRKTISEAQFTVAGIKTTVSLGLVVHPQNGSDPEELLLTAKKALFEAQRTGRNKVVSPSGVWYAREVGHEQGTH